MALDRQKILSELGSVMNQLKSADCGCMGKMFANNEGQSMNNNRQGCCGYGHARRCCGPPGGEACMGHTNGNMGCMGGCMNSGMKPAGGMAGTGHGCMNSCMKPAGSMTGMGHGCMNSGMKPAGSMTGMGHGCMNSGMKPASGMTGTGYGCMNSDMKPPGGMSGTGHCMDHCNPARLYSDTYSYLNQNLMQPVVKEVYQDLQSISPQNTVGNHPLAGNIGVPISGAGGGPTGAQNMGQNGPRQATNPSMPMDMQQMGGFNPTGTGARDVGDNILKMMGHGGGNDASSMNAHSAMKGAGNIGQVDRSGSNMQNGNMGASPSMYTPNQTAQGNPVQSHQSHFQGNHVPKLGAQGLGIKSFQNMFPGVESGDLGFDPMAIAMQMNPANEKKAAYDKISEVINSNRMGNKKQNYDGNQGNSQQSQQLVPGQQYVPAQQQSIPTNQQLIPAQNQLIPAQQQLITPPSQAQQYMPVQQQQYVPAQQTLLSQQQLPGQQTFTTAPGQPNQQLYTALIPQTQQQINPGIVHNSEMENVTNARIQDQPQSNTENGNQPNEMQSSYQYNALGQPVKMVPVYNTPIPELPQTLSPQPNQMRMQPESKLNVKSTMSKTSIMNVGRMQSKSQLQNIYKQYKGAQPYSNNHISRNVQHNLPSGDQKSPPVEKFGGDTASNTIKNDNFMQKIGQSGDVPKISSGLASKQRNGLQDIVFTSYPSSTSWSFH